MHVEVVTTSGSRTPLWMLIDPNSEKGIVEDYRKDGKDAYNLDNYWLYPHSFQPQSVNDMS